MANINESLEQLVAIDGAMVAAVVDSSSGMILGQAGSGLNIELAAAGNTDVVRAKIKTMKALGLEESIEDILITIDTQYHIIRPMATREGIFIYLVLSKAQSNLAMARMKVKEVEINIQF